MIRLVQAPFDPGEALGEFCRDRAETGAVASFTGLARAESGRTDILELEAYPGFTEREIARHEAAARERFGLQDTLILHRTGPISPGEAIVFVAAAASHRRAAFEACDFLMDYLKSRAPFWKKETTPQGTHWVDARVSDDAALARWNLPTPTSTGDAR